MECWSVTVFWGRRKITADIRGWGIWGMVLNTVVRKASVRKRDI